MEMDTVEARLEQLYELMEQEVAGYHLLIEEMKKGSHYLRSASTESLIQSLRMIGSHTDALLGLKKKTASAISEILDCLGQGGADKTLSSLLSSLPPPHHRRIKLYQRTLVRLRSWVSEVNHRNKAFVQESLACVKDLLSLLISPLEESAVYFQNGHKKSVFLSPYSLNRRVE